MSVYKKLLDARRRLNAMSLNKSGKNTFAGYDYYELQDFIKPIHDIMDDVGLMGWVTVTEAVSMLTIVDLDKCDDMIVFTSPTGTAALKGCHDVQNRGAVMTYQRRYLWMLAFEITEADPLDATHGKANGKPEVSTVKAQTKKPEISKLKSQRIELLNDNGEKCYGDDWSKKRAEFCASMNVGSVNDLTEARIQTLIDGIDAKLKEQKEAKEKEQGAS